MRHGAYKPDSGGHTADNPQSQLDRRKWNQSRQISISVGTCKKGWTKVQKETVTLFQCHRGAQR
jgi:hypothetical protein